MSESFFHAAPTTQPLIYVWQGADLPSRR